jgi:carboxypeptidase Q
MLRARWLSVVLLSCCCLTAADAPAPRRLAAVLSGDTPLIPDVQDLCDRIGGRPTGSEPCNRAIGWGAARFKEIGADRVATEEFTVPHRWIAVAAAARVVKPAAFPLRIAAAPFTPSTPGKDAIEARVVVAGEGTAEDFAKLGPKARGAIALVLGKEIHTLEELFGEYVKNPAVMEEARKAGVVAVLWQGTHPRGLLYRHPMSLTSAPAPVPVAVVAREQAARIGRLAQKGDVTVRLLLRNETGGPFQSRNVVADIRGREKPDEIVLLGAHLDSWDLGTGAEDNGINSALVIDVARAVKKLGLQPRRTLRFVLWTGEEHGMWGSAGYVMSHATELDRHVVTITFDIGSGKTMGFFLNGREELRKPVNDALEAAGLNASAHSPEAIDGTDNLDFLLSGVPNLVANQDAANYVPDYHAESDTPDRVNVQEAHRNAAIAAAVMWAFAENPDRPARRQSKVEVDKLITDTRLDEQMKLFGQWEDWTSGRRGRH